MESHFGISIRMENLRSIITKWEVVIKKQAKEKNKFSGLAPILGAFFLAVGVLVWVNYDARGLQKKSTTADLWIEMLIGPPLIPLFNSEALESDIARVDHPSQAPQLEGITNGRKMVVFKSITEAETYLPDLGDKIDLIGYNLEHNPATPPEERDDPIGSIQKMRQLADAYDLELALGPDHDFALSHGPAMAPYVDYFILQIQRRQTEPPVVHEFVSTIVPQLRAANSDLQIGAQVRTEGDVQAIVDLIDSLTDYLDGVSILTSPSTVDIAEELFRALRQEMEPPPEPPQEKKIFLPQIFGY